MKRLHRPDLLRSTIALPAIVFSILILSFAENVTAEPKSGPAVSLMRPFDWTGFYIGGNLGGLLSNYEFRGSGSDGDIFTELDVAQQFYTTLEPFDLGQAETGFATFFGPSHGHREGAPIGGGQLGFNKQFGHFVIGVEGDFNRTSASGSTLFRDGVDDTFIIGDGENTFGNTTFVGTRRAETNWTGSARARLGFANGPWLFYGTGGIAWADVRVWANDVASTDFFTDFNGSGVPDQVDINGRSQFLGTVTSNNVSGGDNDGDGDDVRTGWTAGGGIEWAASDVVTFGLEYRHNDFGNETHHFASHGGPLFPGSTRVDLESDQVTFRMNVLISHFFGHQNYAGTNTKDENISVAYTTADAGSEKWSAKDKNVAVAPVEEPFSWTGFYLGGNVGGTWTDYEFGRFTQEVDLDQQFDESGGGIEMRPEAEISFNFGTASFSFPGAATGGGDGGFDAGSDDGILGGGQLGFNKQFGRFVVGVEGDFGGTSTSQSVSFAGSTAVFDNEGPFLGTAVSNVRTERKAEETWRGSARARFGYTVGADRRLLLYATGGAVWSDVKVWAIDAATTDFFSQFYLVPFPEQIGHAENRNAAKDSNVQCGWTAGGGAEYAITRIASIGLEYRHNGFGDHTYNFDGHHGPIFPGSTRVNLDSDQVTFRVNILLGNAGH